MATCARVCKELGSEHRQVAIDYNFCEFLSDYLYSKNPMAKLEIRNKQLSDLNTEYQLQDLAFTDNDEGFATASALYPEGQQPAQ